MSLRRMDCGLQRRTESLFQLRLRGSADRNDPARKRGVAVGKEDRVEREEDEGDERQGRKPIADGERSKRIRCLKHTTGRRGVAWFRVLSRQWVAWLAVGIIVAGADRCQGAPAPPKLVVPALPRVPGAPDLPMRP